MRIQVFIILGLFLIPTIGTIATSPTEDKPDLMIQSIGYGRHGDAGQSRVVSTTIVNKGNGTANGEIDVKFTIKRLFSLNTVRSGTIEASIYGLDPEDTSPYVLQDVMNLPKFGLFKITCEVNPEHLIEESSHDNNIGSKTFMVFFSIWTPLG